MARPIRIPFVSDVTGFLRGTTDVEQALDDVVDSLDDVSREAQNAGDDAGRALSDGIEDGARDAERALDDIGKSEGLERVGDEAKQAADEVESAAEKMERSFRDAFDAAKKESKGVGDKIGDDTKRGFDKASDGAEEFKSEANSTARESAASFDGSAESIIDSFQEISANAFAGFGPAGAAAGLAAAAGIGFAVKAFQDGEASAEELRERISEATAALNELGSGGVSAASQLADRLTEMSEAADGDKLSDLKEQLDEIGGIDFRTTAQALAGQTDLIDDLIAKTREQRDASDEEREAAIGRDVVAEQGAKDRINAANSLIEKLQEERDVQANAAEERALLEEAGIKELEARARATEETNSRIEEARGAHDERLEQARETNRQRDEDMQQSRVDAARAADQAIADSVLSLTDAYAEVRDAAVKDGKITAEELIGILDQQLADQEQRIANWSWAQQNLTATQRQVLVDMGEDGQAALEGLVNATPELRAEALARLTSVGERKGQAEANGVVTGLERTLPATVEGPRVRIPGVDDGQVQRWIDGIEKRTVYLDIQGRVSGRQPV